jgi:hypothetical protein
MKREIMRNTFKLQRLQILINLFVFVLVPIFLVYYYRRGGIVDGYEENNSLRDLEVWLNAGMKILHGDSPYTDPGHWMKSGSLTTTIYGSAGLFLPNTMLYLVAQILTFVGVWMFIKVIFEGNFQLQRKIFFFTSIASCLRENLVDIQLTGHILLFLALGTNWLKNERSTRFHIRSSLFFVLAVDLKPNICVAFILIILTAERKLRVLLPMAITFLVGYLFLSVWTSTNLLLEWFNVLRGVAQGTETSNLFGSVSIWQALNSLSWVNDRLNFFSIVTFVLIVFLGMLVGVRIPRIAIYISLLSPFFYSFFQYYSFTPIYILAIGIAFQRKDLFLSIFIAVTLVITTNINSAPNAILMIFTLCILLFEARSQLSARKLREVIASLFFAVVLKWSIFISTPTDPDRISLLLTCVLLMVFLRTCRSREIKALPFLKTYFNSKPFPNSNDK